ncbi:LysR family transcriptional regulator [Marinobacter salarius]|uniref:LysR family transcriptional regulator n=1 Tax=Marinobacter salarius TaxID=1420917 RepID=UPI0032ECFB56
MAALEAANHGAISKARGAVNLSQASVTQAISQLERRLSTSLFRRSAQGVTPTAEGQRFLQRVAGADCRHRMWKLLSWLHPGQKLRSRRHIATSRPWNPFSGRLFLIVHRRAWMLHGKPNTCHATPVFTSPRSLASRLAAHPPSGISLQ